MPTIDTKNPRITFARLKMALDKVSELLLKSVSYGDGMERGDIEGNARMALGVSEGIYKADEGEIEVYDAEYRQILEAFGDEFYEREFDITVTYEVADKPGDLNTDVLVGCRFTKRGVSHSSGADGLTYTLGYKPAYVKFGNKNPLKNMPQGAK